MLTQQENEFYTQTGPGTPMGELLRRYWHPVAAAADLDADPVRPVRLLGEDLTLFKAPSSELRAPSATSRNSGPETRNSYGLLTDRCAHRGLSLAYGVPWETGLRCAYHGWTYNTRGELVEAPFEPACPRIKIKAYRAQELGHLIWAYLGPEPTPLLPRWDILVRADLNKSIRTTPLPCSWLQCMDNSLDPIHFEHLHGVYGNYVMNRLGRPPMMNVRSHVKIDFDVFEYGIYKRRLVEGQSEDALDWTVGHPILFPTILAQGSPEEMSFQIRTPIDDTHTMHTIIFARVAPDGQADPEVKVEHQQLPYDDLGRVLGINIPKQDEAAWVGQGAISDRTREHLVTSDKGILLFRRIIRENVERVQRGEDPIGVIRDPSVNEPMIEIRRGSEYAQFKAGVDQENYGGISNYGGLRPVATAR